MSDQDDTSHFSFETMRLLTGPVELVSDHADYQHQISQRRSLLEREIRALQTRHNAFTHTCRLPIEILSDIFLLSSSRFGEGEDQAPKILSRAIRLSHVCRHWRAVALNCASLWSKPVFLNPEAADAMLSRSKGALLDIEYARVPNLAIFVPNYRALYDVSRLRTVSLCLFGENEPMKRALSQWGSPANHLESLFLFDVGRGDSSLPKDVVLFGGSVPALRHLEVSGGGLLWERLPLGEGLLSLSVGHSDFRPHFSGTRPSSTQFLLSLQRLERLQNLTMENKLPDPPFPSTLGTHEPLTLPSIRRLKLEDCFERIRHFFQTTRSPNVLSVKIVFNNLPTNNTLSNTLMQVVSSLRYTTNSRYSNAQGLYLSVGLAKRLSCRIWFQGCVIEANSPLITEDAPLEVEFKGTTQELNIQAFAQIGRHVGFDHLAVLCVDLFYDPIPSDCWDSLGRLPCIPTIAIYRTPAQFLKRFFDALHIPDTPAPPEQELESSTMTIPFPMLSEIFFIKSQFYATVDEVYEVFIPTERLVHELIRRPTVTRLTITECKGFQDSNYQLIAEALPALQLIWDGVVYLDEWSNPPDDDEEDDVGI